MLDPVPRHRHHPFRMNILWPYQTLTGCPPWGLRPYSLRLKLPPWSSLARHLPVPFVILP